MKRGGYAILVVCGLVGLWWLSGQEPTPAALAPLAISDPPVRSPGDLSLTDAPPAGEHGGRRQAQNGEPTLATEPSAESEFQLAHVQVTLVELKSGKPLADLGVRIRPKDPEPDELPVDRALYRWMEEQGWGALRDVADQMYFDERPGGPRTDEHGECLIPWPVGQAFVVAAGSTGGEVGYERVAQPALDSEELRLVTIELPVAPDFFFHGQLLKDGSDDPISGAEIYALSDEWRTEPTLILAPAQERNTSPFLKLLMHSAEDGRFSVGGHSWKIRSMLEDERVLVVAEGFGPQIVSVTQANPSPEAARVIRLVAAAEIHGQLTELHGPGRVELRCDSGGFRTGQHVPVLEPAVWSASWDAEGHFRLGGLAPGLALDVRLRLDSGEVLFPVRPITLEVGENRSVNWSVGNTARVRGVVVDEHGDPVAAADVAALAIDGEAPPTIPGGLIYMSRASSAFVIRDTTDAKGRFDLSGLGPGLWAVGVPILEYPPALDVSDTGILVRVAEGVRELEVRVHVFRDLVIRGQVLGPDGKPLGAAHVFLSSAVGQGFADTRTDIDGVFELGPLAPGLQKLQAWLPDALMYFPAIDVQSGAQGVIVRGREAGSIKGRVFAVDGTHPERVRVRMTTPNGLDSYPTESPGGVFELSAMIPGTYEFIISSPSMEALATVVQIIAGQHNELPDLHLMSAGRLSMQVDKRRAAVARATVRGAGAEYPLDLWPGQTVVLTLPPGPYQLELPPISANLPGRVLDVVVRAGQELEVDLGQW